MRNNGCEDAISDAVITLEDVTVDYGRFRALHGVSLTIPAGATGLVGRNGAGKSTLLRLILGLVRPTSGSGRVLGHDLRGDGAILRRNIGYMPENDALIPGMNGLELVVLAGELCGLRSAEAARRAHEALAYSDLGEARYRKVEHYSAGMRQRLKLAVSLVHDPQLLLLDEPTVGLDPPGRRGMLELIADLVERHGKSVVICTHLLGDIENTCKHVVMFESGRVLGAGPMETLAKSQPNSFRLAWDGSDERFLAALRGDGGEVIDDRSAGRGNGTTGHARISLPANYDPRRIFQCAHEAGVRLWELQPEEEQLADLYHRLLGDPASNGEAIEHDG